MEDSPELHRRIRFEIEAITDCHGKQIFHILGSATGSTVAIEEIERLQPDLIVLDLQLAEGSGIDVLRHFSGRPDAPVIIVLTNHCDTVSRSICIEAGASACFDKSTQFDEFLAELTARLPAR